MTNAATTEEDPILYAVDDGVATITLNRPHRLNAINLDLLGQLRLTLRRFDNDAAASVAIITGAGDKAFCAGGDLKEFSELNMQHAFDFGGDFVSRYPSATLWWEVAKPTIAAVNGYALAGGFMIALQADIRIASDTARFAITEAKIGRAAPWAVPLLWALPSSVGLELLLTGSNLDAERARELGFVNYVVPPDQLLDRARAIAQQICANAPLTMEAHKRWFYRAMDVGRLNGFVSAEEYCRSVYESDDCQEGQRAFREGRSPNWTGR